MKHVSIVAVPKALGSTVSIPLEMISAANDIARARNEEERMVTLEIVSSGSKNIRLSGGMLIHCDKLLSEIEHTDLIFIPGIWGSPRASIRRFPEIPTWLIASHERGALLCGISTGTHFIAETGLLNGKAATTHWRFFDQFQQYYPEAKLERKRFITCVENIYCTGSVNAARDIMLHFIELLFGESIASEISRHFTHELKRSYETLLLDEDQKSTHHDEEIIKVQEWLQDNFQVNIHIADVAKRFKMSVRSLNRRFKHASNSTPLQYLQELRIAHAKALLKQSNLVVAEVADKVGYQDASYFTGLFKKLNAVTPNEYRRLVRNKLFVAETQQQSIQ